MPATGCRGRAAGRRRGTLNKNRFYVQKLYGQAENFGDEELDAAIVSLARLDHALKGGSRLPGELEFTRTLIEITRNAPASAGDRATA